MFKGKSHLTGLAGVMLAGITTAATAQEFEDLQKSKSRLVLDEYGSFFVGGRSRLQNRVT